MAARWVTIAMSGLALLWGYSSAAEEAGFGVRMGQPIAELDHPTKMSDTEWRLGSVPSPHPLLSIYAATATGTVGVCQVTGYLPAVAGDAPRRAITTIKAQLEEVYGKAEHVPVLREPMFEEAWLWLPKDGPKQVTLYRAVTSDRRYGVVLKFEFSNRDECEKVPMPNPFK